MECLQKSLPLIYAFQLTLLIMLEDGTLLDIIRLAIGTIILLYASISDLKTRKASNMLWIIMGSVGVILLVIQYFTIGIENPLYLVFVPFMIALMYILFHVKLIFGGADAKALMALAILVPLKPAILNYPIWESYMPFPWIIFANSVILFLFIPLSLLIYNITKRNVTFPHCLIGYKMSIEKAKEKFVWPLEKIVDGKRKLSLMPDDYDADEKIEAFEKQGIKEIWITPKIPFMIPLLAGFLTSFFLGDIISAIIFSFTGL